MLLVAPDGQEFHQIPASFVAGVVAPADANLPVGGRATKPRIDADGSATLRNPPHRVAILG